ncbi:MAG: hypothetical protein Ct9H300mP8_08920 [Gammaproteobacteria bacterium]|nr:MAG: hypothetical protein Ct9H300mP8_08920 [Gammaproteobacteria bacterium]
MVSEDTIFFGDSGRGLVALDRDTGCTRWTSPVEGVEISTAISPARMPDGRDVLVFGVRQNGIFAVDARDGLTFGVIALPRIIRSRCILVRLLWTEIMSSYPFHPWKWVSRSYRGMGAARRAVLWEPSIYRPGQEVVYAKDKRSTKKDGPPLVFCRAYGPSGAPVWGLRRLMQNVVWSFFGAGQNYSHPTSATSDAIFAVDTSDGNVRWVMQATANDAYSMGCGIPGHPLCPDPVGPDHDFGAPPILSLCEMVANSSSRAKNLETYTR